MNVYRDYTQNELLQIIGTMKRVDKDINIEWRRRYHMNAPYVLTEDGIIKNCLLNAFVADRECDQLILEQANILRKKRSNNDRHGVDFGCGKDNNVVMLDCIKTSQNASKRL